MVTLAGNLLLEENRSDRQTNRWRGNRFPPGGATQPSYHSRQKSGNGRDVRSQGMAVTSEVREWP